MPLNNSIPSLVLNKKIRVSHITSHEKGDKGLIMYYYTNVDNNKAEVFTKKATFREEKKIFICNNIYHIFQPNSVD